MSWKACELVWQRGWRCTISASGSTIGSAVPVWPLPICWDGDLNSHQAFERAARRVAGGKTLLQRRLSGETGADGGDGRADAVGSRLRNMELRGKRFTHLTGHIQSSLKQAGPRSYLANFLELR